mgnify:CR=1 FL=1
MNDILHEHDPFRGDNRPGRYKKYKSKKLKKDKRKFLDDAGSSTISYPLSKSSRKSSKKGKKSKVQFREDPYFREQEITNKLSNPRLYFRDQEITNMREENLTNCYFIELTNKSFRDSGSASDETYTSIEEQQKSKKGPVGFSKKRTTRRTTEKFGPSRIYQVCFSYRLALVRGKLIKGKH